MKAFFLLLVIFTSESVSRHLSVMDCRIFIDFTFYDINDLQKNGSDYQIKNAVYNSSNGMPYNLLFNFCGSSLQTIPTTSSCGINTGALAVLITPDGSNCSVLSYSAMNNINYNMNCKNKGEYLSANRGTREGFR